MFDIKITRNSFYIQFLKKINVWKMYVQMNSVNVISL